MRARTPAAALLLVLATGCTGGSGSATPGLSPAPSTTGTPSPTADAAQGRAEQQRLATTYPVALRPTVESVYDQVQPMLDAFDAFDRPRVENAQVRDDVFAAGGARVALEARLRELRGAKAPTSFAPRVKELDGALVALAKAAGTLSAATRAAPGADGSVPQYRQGEQAMDAAVGTWARTVTAVYGGKAVPLTPRRDRTGVRAPSSKGAWLFVAGQTCARAKLPRVAAAELVRVALPAADAARLRTRVLAPLAQVRASNGRPARAAVAQGLAEYGSSVCAEVFAVREG